MPFRLSSGSDSFKVGANNLGLKYIRAPFRVLLKESIGIDKGIGLKRRINLTTTSRLGLILGLGFRAQDLGSTWRFMGSYKWGSKSQYGL